MTTLLELRSAFTATTRRHVILALLLTFTWTEVQAGRVLHVPQDHATIQAAVDAAAAAGDEVRISAGTYQQQVVVTGKQLVITGEPGAVLQAWPGQPVNPEYKTIGLIWALEGADLTVRGLKLDGARLGELAPEVPLMGILYLESKGVIEGCTIEHFRGEQTLARNWSIGVWVARYKDGDPVHVVVRNNQFRDNGASIYLRGNSEDLTGKLRVTFAIVGNTIEGVGPTDMDRQFGMFIGPGVSGVVRNNRVTDHFGLSDGIGWGAAISMTWEDQGVTHQPVRFEGNTLVGNRQGIVASRADRVEIVNNVIQGGGKNDLDSIGLAVTGQQAVVAGNQISAIPTAIGLTIFPTGPAGIANGTLLFLNRVCDVALTLDAGPSAVGTLNRAPLGCETPAPTNRLLRLDPSAGRGGDAVLIAGPDLNTARRVIFGATAADFVTETNATGEVSLRATVPARARTGKVVVIMSTGLAISTHEFTRLAPLSVAREENGKVALTWPAGFEDYELESSPRLGGTQWTPVVGQPTRVGAEFKRSMDGMGDAGFFRLRAAE